MLKRTAVVLCIMIFIYSVGFGVDTKVDISTLKTMTLEELSKCDGLQNHPAYVAVDGIIYDVTKIREFRGGKHQGICAGQDVTKALKEFSPHGMRVIKKLKAVAKLTEKK